MELRGLSDQDLLTGVSNRLDLLLDEPENRELIHPSWERCAGHELIEIDLAMALTGMALPTPEPRPFRHSLWEFPAHRALPRAAYHR